ncbi:hypothetical protein [Microbispora sp. NPDC049633]|uniref:hypothetical protein n=1 Tax=Microbispora sp. NPDC049633 TaxID=3154355 RepID=UPI0034307CD6
MKAADIKDEGFLAAVERVNDSEDHWALVWDIEAAFPGVPRKVLLAKARRLIRRGVLDGCDCGCRGDFYIPAWNERRVVAWREGSTS